MPPPPPNGATPGVPWGRDLQGREIRDHPDGTTVLVLGILGVVVCGVLAPIAWVKGRRAQREIDAHPGVLWTNASAVTAGRICGIVGTALACLWAAVVAVLVVAALVG